MGRGKQCNLKSLALNSWLKCGDQVFSPKWDFLFLLIFQKASFYLVHDFVGGSSRAVTKLPSGLKGSKGGPESGGAEWRREPSWKARPPSH